MRAPQGPAQLDPRSDWADISARSTMSLSGQQEGGTQNKEALQRQRSADCWPIAEAHLTPDT